MRDIARKPRVNIAVLLVLLFSLVPAAGLAPHVARAEGRTIDAPDAPSADTSKEIVYVTAGGVITVWDLTFSGKQVQWVSPTNNWRSIALGDFNNDGDDEIAAVRGTFGTSATELAVFDPVVASGATVPGQEINGIPWKLLYSATLPSTPALVFAGNFDVNVPGDEIGIVRTVAPGDPADAGDPTMVVIYKQTSLTPDGTSWTIHQQKSFSENWERVAVGNMDRSGGDDVAFVDEDQGKFTVFRPDANFAEVDGPGGSDSRPFKDVTFGQYQRGGNQEVLAVREGGGLNSFLVFEFSASNNSIDSSKGDKFDPGPRFIFAGDLNDSGDDEAIMLRRCTGNCRRLIVRNDGDDKVIQEFLDGLPLDDDNEWRAGVAADIDGDEMEEIIIIRSNKLRWYPDANTSARDQTIDVSTDRRNIFAGDLDRNGFISGPTFGSTPGQVRQTVYFGFKSTGTVQLKNVSTNDVVPFVATTTASWLTVSPSAGTVPGANGGGLNITYQIDATTLQPGNTYTASLTFASTNPSLGVTNSPYSVPVVATVQLPPFGAIPDSVTALYVPCEEPLAEQRLALRVTGFPGNQFNARVLEPIAAASVASLEGGFFLGETTENGVLLTDRNGAQVALPGLDVTAAATNVDWPSDTAWVTAASSLASTLPTTLTLTISPTLRTTDFAQSILLLSTTNPENTSQLLLSAHSIYLLCTPHASWLPQIAKQ